MHAEGGLSPRHIDAELSHGPEPMIKTFLMSFRLGICVHLSHFLETTT
jgi:hypothetical protein